MFLNTNVVSSAIRSTRMASDFLLIQFLHTILKDLVVRSAWYKLLRFTPHPAEREIFAGIGVCSFDVKGWQVANPII